MSRLMHMKTSPSATSAPQKILALDVDGVINIPDTSKLEPGTFTTFKITRPAAKNMHGEIIYVEEAITITHELLQFIQYAVEAGVEIWWLTGWKANAVECIDPLLGIESDGWIDWELGFEFATRSQITRETGKVMAFEEFLKTCEVGARVVWADDIATQDECHFLKDFHNESWINVMKIQTDDTQGLHKEWIEEMALFLGI